MPPKSLSVPARTTPIAQPDCLLGDPRRGARSVLRAGRTVDGDRHHARQLLPAYLRDRCGLSPVLRPSLVQNQSRDAGRVGRLGAYRAAAGAAVVGRDPSPSSPRHRHADRHPLPAPPGFLVLALGMVLRPALRGDETREHPRFRQVSRVALAGFRASNTDSDGGVRGGIMGAIRTSRLRLGLLLRHRAHLAHGSLDPIDESHRRGYRNFDTSDQSRNHWLLAIVSLGEYHNNHHHRPHSAQQGLRWWEVDVTFWLLRGLGALGLVWDVRNTVQLPHRIYARRAVSAPPRNERTEGGG